jgi:phage-related tail protein
VSNICCKKQSETMQDDPKTYYERRLMQAIEEIEARIKELQDEKAALMRQLRVARWESDSLKDVNRKNSGVRVMVERRVLDALRAAKKPVTSDALYREALKANFELKDGTFRTYLHRMKEKGLLQSAGWGLWRLPPVERVPSNDDK